MINGATQIGLTKLDALYPECKGARNFEEIPKAAREFIAKVEKETGTPVVFIGTGPDALDLVDRRK
jgi:adenylosuccinate synthase